MVHGLLYLLEMEQMMFQWFLKLILELESEEKKVHKQSDPQILLWVNSFIYRDCYCAMVGGDTGELVGLFVIISTKM